MCGRFALTYSRATLERHAHTTVWYAGAKQSGTGDDGDEHGDRQRQVRARYNVSPQQCVPVVRAHSATAPSSAPTPNTDTGARCLHSMRWGILSSSAPSPASRAHAATQPPPRPINARCESLLHKPTFRTPLMRGQRCVVIVNGFYEWHAAPAPGTVTGGERRKTPYFIRMATSAQTSNARAGADDDAPMYLAALYDAPPPMTAAAAAGGAGRDASYTFTIITMPARAHMSWLHDRMPAILADKRAVEQWLDVHNLRAQSAVSRLRWRQRREGGGAGSGSGNKSDGDDHDDGDNGGRREPASGADRADGADCTGGADAVRDCNALCADNVSWYAVLGEVSSPRNDRAQILLPREIAIERSKQRGIVGMFAAMKRKGETGGAVTGATQGAQTNDDTTTESGRGARSNVGDTAGVAAERGVDATMATAAAQRRMRDSDAVDAARRENDPTWHVTGDDSGHDVCGRRGAGDASMPRGKRRRN